MSFDPRDFEEEDGFDEEAAAALDEIEYGRPSKRQRSTTVPAQLPTTAPVIDLSEEADTTPNPFARRLPPPTTVPTARVDSDVDWSEEAELRRLEGLPPPVIPPHDEAPALPPKRDTSDVCNLCGQVGHWAKDCPEPRVHASMC